MIRKIYISLIFILTISVFAIAMSTEKRTSATRPAQDNDKNKLINFEPRNLVPSGRWQWRSRWQVGTPTQWQLYDGDRNRAGKWLLPWANTSTYERTYSRHHGYYNSRIPYAPREHWYRYRDFHPGDHFNRFRHHRHYYPFGHFYRYSYPRYFNSFRVYPFWAWNWYPSWWMAYDYPWTPGYSYYEYWYPRRYYHPADEYNNKYFARISTNIEPDAALVYIDGYLIGKASDHNGWWLTIPVKAGKHVAEFKLEGYKTYKMEFEVAPQQYLKISHRMLPESPEYSSRTYRNDFENEDGNYYRGKLMLDKVQPPDASVYIDNKFIGTYRDLQDKNTLIMLDAGKHNIYVASPAFIPYNTEFEINAQDTTHLTVKLEARRSI